MALIETVKTNMESLQNAQDTLAELLDKLDKGFQRLNLCGGAPEVVRKENPVDAPQKMTEQPNGPNLVGKLDRWKAKISQLVFIHNPSQNQSHEYSHHD